MLLLNCLARFCMVLQICQVVSIIFKCFSHLFTVSGPLVISFSKRFCLAIRSNPSLDACPHLSTSHHDFKKRSLCHGMKAERFGPVPGWSNSGCIRMLSLENDHSFFLYHPIPVKTTIIYNSLFKILWQFREKEISIQGPSAGTRIEGNTCSLEAPCQ